MFQFPSNGKAHVHRTPGLAKRYFKGVFQFPSNGKAHVHLDHASRYCMFALSIPFKRESTCARRKDFKFQFPSNGKAHVHSIIDRNISAAASFNSLQTGKHMCTFRSSHIRSGTHRFNSLQTGKHMCTLGSARKEQG